MLRLAGPEDIPDLKRMSYSFYGCSPYSEFDIAEDKVEAVIQDLLNAPKTERIVILSCQPHPVGMIAGLSQELLFSRKQIALELMWWMDPDYRKSRDALKLIEAYEYWASNVVKADVIQLSLLATQQSPQIEKYYSRKGYTLSEKSFYKEVGNARH